MNIIDDIIELKLLGASGLKQSLEDEGASFDDIISMKKISDKVKLPLNVKIGGCEAKNDIYFCQTANVNGIVAPMIESEYAVTKFLQVASQNKKSNCSLYVNLETITAFKNINKIIKSKNFKKLTGVIIGRSDLVGSMNKEKKFVDSKVSYQYVCAILQKLRKKKKIIIKMGGSITHKSFDFISKLYEKNLLDRIETRNIELFLNKKTLNNFHKIIEKIFLFELNWLKYKLKKIKNNNQKKEFYFRIKEMSKRLKTT